MAYGFADHGFAAKTNLAKVPYQTTGVDKVIAYPAASTTVAVTVAVPVIVETPVSVLSWLVPELKLEEAAPEN